MYCASKMLNTEQLEVMEKKISLVIWLIFSKNIFKSKKFILPLSHQEIANFSEISKKSCTRRLSNFKKSGVIRFNNTMAEIIDIEKLKNCH